ncbi:hypothetical protein F5Y13DRAFT_164111 [Hypoxylon sp. FL1857]|nr:hypothetical protein F5Y13DRAFT_164111 [Hypoxylon sp. FL1857]
MSITERAASAHDTGSFAVGIRWAWWGTWLFLQWAVVNFASAGCVRCLALPRFSSFFLAWAKAWAGKPKNAPSSLTKGSAWPPFCCFTI